jgi:hypothetical protein
MRAATFKIAETLHDRTGYSANMSHAQELSSRMAEKKTSGDCSARKRGLQD